MPFITDNCTSLLTGTSILLIILVIIIIIMYSNNKKSTVKESFSSDPIKHFFERIGNALSGTPPNPKPYHTVQLHNNVPMLEHHAIRHKTRKVEGSPYDPSSSDQAFSDLSDENEYLKNQKHHIKLILRQPISVGQKIAYIKDQLSDVEKLIALYHSPGSSAVDEEELLLIYRRDHLQHFLSFILQNPLKFQQMVQEKHNIQEEFIHAKNALDKDKSVVEKAFEKPHITISQKKEIINMILKASNKEMHIFNSGLQHYNTLPPTSNNMEYTQVLNQLITILQQNITYYTNLEQEINHNPETYEKPSYNHYFNKLA